MSREAPTIDLLRLFAAFDEVMLEPAVPGSDRYLTIARRATGLQDLEWLPGQRNAVKCALFAKMYTPVSTPLSELFSTISRSAK